MIPRSKFSFINPYDAHRFLKILKKCRQFRCTGLLHSSKLVHLDGKKLTFLTWNLMQILMNLVFFFLRQQEGAKKWLELK